MILLFYHEKEMGKLGKIFLLATFCKIENMVKIVKNKEYGGVCYA